jgi:geranylgeranyl diphosphate synthase type II
MNIPRYQEMINAELDAFANTLPASPENLYEPIRYTISLGGKRMRPLLAVMGAGLFTENITPSLPAAIGIELFHNFTLLHDDIMDNAPLRRGKQTVFAKWNSNIAILSGDALYTEAFRQVAKSPANVLPSVLDIFTRTALGVCEGQQMDMDFESRDSVSISEYIRMIELKTAVLLAGAMEIGALCGGADAAEAHKLYEFGRRIGIAFQLQDDILDVYGDPDKFGKQVGGDIVSNKKTYLLLTALQRANGYHKESLLNWLQSNSDDAAEKVRAVKEIYDTFGVRAAAEEEMQKEFAEGIHALESISADKTKIAAIRSIAESLMVRQH